MSDVTPVIDWLQEKIETDPHGMIWIIGVRDEIAQCFGAEFVGETELGMPTLSNRVKRAFKKRMGNRIRVDRDGSGGAIWVLQN